MTGSPRERILAAYRRRPSDRLSAAIYGRYLPRSERERLLRNLGLGIIESVPLVSLLAPPWHTMAGYMSVVKGADLDISFSWESGERIETRTYSTPVGTVSQQLRVDPSYGSDWITKHYVQSPGDYRVLRYIVENTVFRENGQAFLSRQAQLGQDGVVLGRVDRSPFQKLLIELAGPERFLLDLNMDPEPVLELLDALDRKMDEMFEFVLDSPADVIWQPDNITSATTPPKYFEKYCLPFYSRHGGACHAAGKLYLVHVDGRARALKDLIARAPIDGVESLSIPESGGDLTLAEARAAWPDKALLPNFPASLSLQPDAVIEDFLAGFVTSARQSDVSLLQFSEDVPPAELTRVLAIVIRFFSG